MDTHATKLPEPLSKRVEEYADEQDVTKSEALRALIRSGLDRHENPHTFSLAVALAWVGSIFVAADAVTVGPTVAAAGYVLLGVGVLLHSSQAVSWLRSLRASTTRELRALRDEAGLGGGDR